MKFYVYDNIEDFLPKEIADNVRLKKVFTYKRLIVDGKEEKDPSKASYFIVPTLFLFDEFNKIEKSDLLMDKFCHHLPYWKRNKDRHIFLDQSDECVISPVLSSSILFTTTPSKTNPLHNALPFYPYKHEWLNVRALLEKPFSSCKFDLFFKGCGDNMDVRKKMIEYMPTYERNGFSTYVKTYSRYFWNQDISDKKKQEERIHYFDRMTDSKFVLCPRGKGTTSSRFFEAIYFGRIPVLISDNCKLPLEKKIDWNNLIVNADPLDLPILHKKIYEFISKHDLVKVSDSLKRLSQEYFTLQTMFKMIRDTLK